MKPKGTADISKGERRREEIIAIARAILINDGYDSFVLRAIAEQAGMKLGNLQYYFATREALLEEVARAENRRALEILEAITADDGTPDEKISRLVKEIVGEWNARGGKVFAVVTLLAIHKPRFRRLYTEYYALFYAAIGELLVDLEPDLAPSEIRRKARLATSLLDGASLQVPLHRGRGSKKERTEFLAELAGAMRRILGYAQ